MTLPTTYRGNTRPQPSRRSTFVVCPATDELVPTGVAVDRLVEVPRRNLLPFCPSCGADHEWRPQDATFVAQ